MNARNALVVSPSPLHFHACIGCGCPVDCLCFSPSSDMAAECPDCERKEEYRQDVAGEDRAFEPTEDEGDDGD